MRLEKSFGWFTTEMKIKTLVYGYYDKSNLGDDLFADAFQSLFPNYQFTFTDHIKPHHLENMDAVFFGGGSFLAESLKASPEAFELLKKMNLFYIGVGSETALDKRHQELISLAKLVAVRTQQNFSNIQQLNPNSMVMPDLVYALEAQPSEEKIPKSILVIPNVLVVPKWNDPHWKHVAWDYFKSEFIQAVDALVIDQYRIDFLPFCQNVYLNDSFAAAELLSRSNTMIDKTLYDKPKDFQSAINIISKYNLVITQRFHGNILSEIAGIPTLTIHHHDKLKGVNGATLSYYGLTKNLLLDNIKSLMSNSTSVLPIDRDIYIELKQRVEHEICRSKK